METQMPPMPSEVRERPDADKVWWGFCCWAGFAGHSAYTGEQLRWFLRGWDAAQGRDDLEADVVHNETTPA